MIYNIKEIADELRLEFVRMADDESAYYLCPFCGGRVLNLNFKKGCWRCNKCGEGGSAKKLVQMVLRLNEEDLRIFLKRMREKGSFFANEEEANTYLVNGSCGQVTSSPRRAPEDKLDLVYRAMLRYLVLEPEHRADLRKRGLLDEEIDEAGFKSVPKSGFTIPRVLEQNGICNDFRGVPGFYREKGFWKINTAVSGYFVPFINANGFMTGLQIRNDNPQAGAKYVSFTSVGKDLGTKSKIEAALVGYNGQRAIGLTEGALKATVAHYLSKRRTRRESAFLSIPGVNNTSTLMAAMAILKEKGVTDVYNALDMDRMGNKDVKVNPNVKKGSDKIRILLEENGFTVHDLTWEHEKGIDDFLLKQMKKRG